MQNKLAGVCVENNSGHVLLALNQVLAVTGHRNPRHQNVVAMIDGLVVGAQVSGAVAVAVAL